MTRRNQFLNILIALTHKYPFWYMHHILMIDVAKTGTVAPTDNSAILGLDGYIPIAYYNKCLIQFNF